MERYNDDDGDGTMELRENERNDILTPNINNHSYSFFFISHQFLANPNRKFYFPPTFLNSIFFKFYPFKTNFSNFKFYPFKIHLSTIHFTNYSNQTLGFPQHSTQALRSSSKYISQGGSALIENVASLYL